MTNDWRSGSVCNDLRMAAAVALVVVGSVAAACSRQPNSRSRSDTPAPAEKPAQPNSLVATPTLAAAFAAVYPKATVEVGSDVVEFRPALIERVGPGTFALASGGQVVPRTQVGHVTFGYASIAYLEAGPRLALMAKPLLINLSRGGFGAPPTIQALEGVSQTPMIALISSYGNQGVFDDAVTLVALGPTPAALRTVSDSIPIGHAAPGPCDIEGKIVPVTPDKAFDIQFSGAFHGRERVVLAHGQWTPRGAEPDLQSLC